MPRTPHGPCAPAPGTRAPRRSVFDLAAGGDHDPNPLPLSAHSVPGKSFAPPPSMPLDETYDLSHLAKPYANPTPFRISDQK